MSGEEFFIGKPSEDGEFVHCPVCGEEMTWFQDTLVCRKCDKIPIADLKWCKDHGVDKDEKTKTK